MGLNIDELEVKISGSSEKAEKSIDKLIAKLEALKKSVNRTSGLDKLAEKINKISASIHSITGIDKLSQMAESIGKLSSIKSPNVTKTVNSIRKLSEAYNSIGSMGNVNLESLKSSISVIVDACKPMENMGKNNFAPFLNSLKKIPEITKNLDNSKIEEFAKRIRQLTAAIEPLTSSVSKAEKGLVALNGIVKSSVASNGNLAAANAAATKSYTSLSTVLRDVRTKIISVYVGFSKTSDFLADCSQSSNEYVENVNLFTVAMGEYAEEAYNYAEQVNKLLGIDISEWIRFQGVFKQITTGFGVAADKSNLMSKNLAQIGYDIASFYNISIEESMQKIQSGISGELEPLRRLGYALDAATLQQIAYDNGITQNINTMTQAQKSQLRYIAIMQQSTNVMGDMARTIITPANSMRILQQQMEQLKRAIGNIVSVFAVKLIPYVQVLIRLLTDAANAVADWLGFELPTIDYSQAGKGLTSVTEEADNATEAVKETQDQLLALAGFDEINQLNLDKGKKDDSGDATIGNNYDLGIDLPEYDFLAGLDEQTDKLYKQIKNKLKDIYEWLKKHKKIIGTIAGILTGIWAVGKIKKFIDKVKDLKTAFDNLSIIKTAKDWLKNFTDGFKSSDAKTFFGKLSDGAKNFRDKLSPAAKLLGTIAGTALASYGGYNLFKDLTTDTANWKSVLGDSAAIVGGLGMSWLFGGGKGLAIGVIVTAFSALKGVIDEAKQSADKALETLLKSEWRTAGIPVSEIGDSYHDLITNLTSSEDAFITASGNLDSIKGSAQNAYDVLTPLISTLSTDNWDAESMETAKGAFSDLATNTQSYADTALGSLQTYVNSNSEFITAVGGDVDHLNQIISSCKSNVDDEISGINEKISDIYAAAEERGSLTESEISEISQLADQLAKYSGINIGTSNSQLQDMVNEISTLENMDINLENIETVKTVLTNLGTDISNSKESLKTAKDELFNTIEMYFTGEDAEELKETFGKLFELKEGQLDQITASTKTITDKVDETIQKGLEDIENGHLEGFGTYFQDWVLDLFGGDGNLSEQEIKKAQQEWLNQIGITDGADNFLKNAMLENGMTLTDYESIVNSTAYIEEMNKLGEKVTESSAALANSAATAAAESLRHTIQATKNSPKFPDDELFSLIIGASDSQIKGLQETMKEYGTSIGEALPEGFIRGNQKDLERVIKVLGDDCDQYLLAYKQALDINSPSKKTEEIGIYYIMGFINGIFSRQILMLSTIISTAKSAVTTFNSNVDVTFAGEKFADTFINGIRDNKSRIVNEVVDMFNEILNRTDTFNIKLMDTFNSAIPHFQSMGNTLASLAGSASMQINGINYTAPGYRVKGYDGEYASGGFPQTGQLFIARENGIPEMVGSIGGKNAVANNDQIEQAIFKAVYTAMRESNRDNQNSRGTQSNVNLKVSADEHSFVRVAVDGINDITRRTGKSPLKS